MRSVVEDHGLPHLCLSFRSANVHLKMTLLCGLPIVRSLLFNEDLSRMEMAIKHFRSFR